MNPEAYELRIIDDEKAVYTPSYEVGALDRRERIGSMNESLAFVQAKNYKPKNTDSIVDVELLEKLKRENVSSLSSLSFLETFIDNPGEYKSSKNKIPVNIKQ